MNFLEQLAAEWYTLQGYFVRTNLKFGKRPEGGWIGEMDVVAIDPKTRQLVHIETSMDADSWQQGRARFARKFKTAKAHYSDLFKFDLGGIRRIAIVGFSSKGKTMSLEENVEVWGVAEFVSKIGNDLRNRHPMRKAVPETLPLLRAMQFALFWGLEKTD